MSSVQKLSHQRGQDKKGPKYSHLGKIHIAFLIRPSARKCPTKEAWKVHDETNFSPVYQIFHTQILYTFPKFLLVQSVPKIQLLNDTVSSYRLITKVISALQFHTAERRNLMGRLCRIGFTYFFHDAETAVNAVLPTQMHITRLNDITSVKNLGRLNMSQTSHLE